MKSIENECVGCPPEMGCLGNSCPYINVTRFYCDKCGSETTLYHCDDRELCEDCLLEEFEEEFETEEYLLEEFEIVDGSDW